MTRQERPRRGVCLCCGEDVVPERQAGRPALPFCSPCVSGKRRKCRSWVYVEKLRRDPTSKPIEQTFNPVGRPRRPQMPCGWGCGATLTGSRCARISQAARIGHPSPTACAKTQHSSPSAERWETRMNQRQVRTRSGDGREPAITRNG